MSFISCAELSDHLEQNCNNFKHGGFSSAAILKLGHSITDYTNTAQWNNAIATGFAKIINQIKAQMPEASEVTVDNPVACGAEQILDGFNNSATWVDANVNQGNNDFYNTLNISKGNLVLFSCTENEVTVIEETVTFMAKKILPPNRTEYQSYSVTANWTTTPETGIPPTFTAPANIFAQV